MPQQRPLFLSILVATALALVPGSSFAQTQYRYTVGLMAGFGGTTGSEPASATVDDVFLREDRFDLGFQLLFDMEIRRGTSFVVRLGQMDVEIDDAGLLAPFTPTVDSELTYLTLAGEYSLSAGYYQSSLFLGVGYYGIDGQNVFEDDTGLGLTVGTTGDFRVNDRLSVLVELSGHYADVDYAQFFIMGHAGLAFHF